MDQNTVIVTGAAGFLGSAVTVDLARDHNVIAIDLREPGRALRRATPGVAWESLDIADAQALAATFRRARSRPGRVDFVVHLAAFYHFGKDWLPEYDRTNIRGTSNVLEAAINTGVRRVIFGSSIAAMEPPPPGQALTEAMPACDLIPYARSKRIGEEMLGERADKLPGVALRIGGAFSDWCELPPLYSLIRMWSGWGPLSCLVPGRGESGIPYIHRSELVGIVRRCIERHETLAPLEVLFASRPGAVSHRVLFPVVRQMAGRGAWTRPIFIPPGLARLGLWLKLALSPITGGLPYERPWMLDFVDRPWLVDISYTQQKLGWHPSPGKGILDRLPVILERFVKHRRAWEARNRCRNAGQYLY